MKILGIDPGYGRCGYAVLEGNTNNPRLITAGVITTKPTSLKALRIKEIAEDFQYLLQNFQPDIVAIEDLFFVQNITTGLKVAEVRGVLLYLASSFGCQITEPKPTEIKAAFTGDGKADKHAILKMAQQIFQVENLIDDAADAIAVAWHSLQEARFMV